MNDNPGGTPNPLNPAPLAPVPPETPETPEMMAWSEDGMTGTASNVAASDATGVDRAQFAQPTPTRRITMQDIRPMSQPRRTHTNQSPARMNQAPAQAIHSSAPANQSSVQTMHPPVQTVPEPPLRTIVDDPMPTPKDSIVEPVKKKKHGLLAALLILLVVGIGAAVVAVILLKPFDKKDDKVPAAMSKLLSGNAASKVSLKGSVTVVSDDEESQFSTMVVDFDSGVNLKSTENFVNAAVTATLSDGQEFSFDAEEVHSQGNDLYMRLNGLTLVLNNYKAPTTSTSASPTLLDSIGVFEAFDNEWIRIPDNSFSNATDIYNMNTAIACLADAAGELGEFSNNLGSKYQANQFVTYSTENLAINKKANTLYRIGFDNEKLAAFINSMPNSGFMNSLLACTGSPAVSGKVTSAMVAEITARVPSLYVEIDNNNNFTRLYFRQASTSTCQSAI